MSTSHTSKQLEVTYDIEIILLSTQVSLGPVAGEVFNPLSVCKPNQNHIFKIVDVYVSFCVQETYFATLP